MDISGQMLLAYLEEDDERKVLFRVRPVLSAQGAVNPEDLEEYGEEGFLRVAPDRGEQHSFKERMRSLGKLCLINLQGTQGALFKVRPNKNYAPSRGETNRYIIYSDAVQALPPEMVYEVVSEEKALSSLTRQYYLRAGGRISGPHCPEGSLACPNSQTLMPDCERLFYVELPDGTSAMFYWPEQLAAPAEETPAMEEPLVEPAPIVQDEKPAETVPAEKTPEVDALLSAAERLEKAALSAGFRMDAARAGQLAVLLAVSPKLMVQAGNPADSRTLARLLSEIQIEDEDAVKVLHRDHREVPGRQRERYLSRPWPVFSLKTADGIPGGSAPEAAISIPALRARAGKALENAPEETFTRLQALITYADTHSQSLPLCLRQMMARGLALGAELPEAYREGLFEGLAAALLIPYEQVSGMGKSVTAAFLAP